MVRIDLVYEGELRVRAAHGPSAAELTTDAPVDNCGRGESFSPTDLVATALGTCMATLIGITAQKRAWPLERFEVSVEKHMVADPRRRIGRLDVAMRVPGDWSEEQRAVLRAAAETCPVAESLRAELQVELAIDWLG